MTGTDLAVVALFPGLQVLLLGVMWLLDWRAHRQ